MAVAAIPRDLRQVLGDTASESLAELIRQAARDQRDDLLTMVEERFARRLVETRADLQAEIGAVRAELKAEIASLRTELHEQIGSVRKEIESVRTELHEQIGSVRTELHEQIGSVRKEIESVRTELHEQIGGVRADLKEQIAKQTRWLMTTILAAAALIPTITTLVPKLIP